MLIFTLKTLQKSIKDYKREQYELFYLAKILCMQYLQMKAGSPCIRRSQVLLFQLSVKGRHYHLAFYDGFLRWQLSMGINPASLVKIPYGICRITEKELCRYVRKLLPNMNYYLTLLQEFQIYVICVQPLLAMHYCV